MSVLSGLTALQMQVVEWLVEQGHEDNPIAAANAGLVSPQTLYSKWKVDNVKAWCAAYKADKPKGSTTAAEVQAYIQTLVPAALQTLTLAIQQGRGDRVGVDLAKWILQEATAKAEDEGAGGALSEAEKELGNVLKGVFSS